MEIGEWKWEGGKEGRRVYGISIVKPFELQLNSTIETFTRMLAYHYNYEYGHICSMLNVFDI